MTTTSGLPADETAQRIVRHFQNEGFPGITEALLIRIRLKTGDQMAVEAAFDMAAARDLPPPMRDFFEIRPWGHFAQGRTFAAARAAFQADFGLALRRELPSIYFEQAPLVKDDALASDTKYDAMLKLSDNSNGQAIAILLNDPTSSFFEYLGSHTGFDWPVIMGNLNLAATGFDLDGDIL